MNYIKIDKKTPMPKKNLRTVRIFLRQQLLYGDWAENYRVIKHQTHDKFSKLQKDNFLVGRQLEAFQLFPVEKNIVYEELTALNEHKAKGHDEISAICQEFTEQAEAKAIEQVRSAIPNGDPLPYLIAMQYIKALPEITKGQEGKTVVIPYEAGSLIGSLTSVKQIFEQIK